MSKEDVHPETLWRTILEDARWYPSPHNSQPIRLKIKDKFSAELFYDKKCGLPAESYGIPFGFVCVGVFLECLQIVARAYGMQMTTQLELADMDFTSDENLHFLGTVTLKKDSAIHIPEAKEILEVYRRRQTSRRPYDNKLVPEDLTKSLQNIAKKWNYVFDYSNDSAIVKQIITINQRTLFDDLERDPVYFELMEWLRFSEDEAREKSDGLSAQTMLMPGKLLHFAMKHRNLWRLPIIGALFRWVYLRTMTGVRQLGWLKGKFVTNHDYVRAGQCFMNIWMECTAHNVYLHPYGTVITNPKSHKAFVEVAQIKESDEVMAWMLFRFGYSKQPPHSYRRPADNMIVEE